MLMYKMNRIFRVNENNAYSSDSNAIIGGSRAMARGDAAAHMVDGLILAASKFYPFGIV